MGMSEKLAWLKGGVVQSVCSDGPQRCSVLLANALFSGAYPTKTWCKPNCECWVSVWNTWELRGLKFAKRPKIAKSNIWRKCALWGNRIYRNSWIKKLSQMLEFHYSNSLLPPYMRLKQVLIFTLLHLVALCCGYVREAVKIAGFSVSLDQFDSNLTIVWILLAATFEIACFFSKLSKSPFILLLQILILTSVLCITMHTCQQIQQISTGIFRCWYTWP